MRSGCVNSESRLMLGNYAIDFILSKLLSKKKSTFLFKKGEINIIWTQQDLYLINCTIDL